MFKQKFQKKMREFDRAKKKMQRLMDAKPAEGKETEHDIKILHAMDHLRSIDGEMKDLLLDDFLRRIEGLERKVYMLELSQRLRSSQP